MPTVCFDFDGVLAQYSGWCEDGGIGEPIPAGVELLKLLKGQGFKIVISTCRTHPEHVAAVAQYCKVAEWLQKHGLYSSVSVIDTVGKPMADVYVDNKALFFDQSQGRNDQYAEYMFGVIMDRVYGEGAE